MTNLPVGVWMLGVGAFACTMTGGLIALRLGSRTRFVTGLSAGAVVGLALFDLVPEAIKLSSGPHSPSATMLAVGVGFGLYMVIQRTLEGLSAGRASNHLGAASLTLHSLFDGLGIGLAFKISAGVGLAVAVAVLAHDICDGVNTVVVALRGETKQARRVATRWLCADAAAPLLGIALAGLTPLSPADFAPLAAGFAGVFLYIGAGELLPRGFAGWPSPLASLPPIAGLALIYAVASVMR